MRSGESLTPKTRLLDRAGLLKLTALEMTMLVGGMRALNANFSGSRHGIFTDEDCPRWVALEDTKLVVLRYAS